jgi:hypothetical protein
MITATSGSSQYEIVDFSNKLATYFHQIKDYITSVANPCPMFDDTAGTILFDRLVTESNLNVDKSPNPITGYQIDAIQFIMCVNREYAMRAKSRQDLYTEAASDYNITAEFYESYGARGFNTLRTDTFTNI